MYLVRKLNLNFTRLVTFVKLIKNIFSFSIKQPEKKNERKMVDRLCGSKSTEVIHIASTFIPTMKEY